MVFSDLFFLFAFIPAFVVFYLLATWIDRKWLSGTLRARNGVLVVFSLLFYAWGEPVYVFLMLFSVLANFLLGLQIAKRQDSGRKWALGIGVAINVLIIGVFKYAGFAVEIVNDITGMKLANPGISLPIGISFYTFQAISYLVDVYRRESPVQRRYIDLLLYISMFPQLIAGPIVRYDTVAHELHHRRVSSRDVSYGVYRFMIGLGKKVIIANQIGELATQLMGPSHLGELSTAGAWLGAAAYGLQIFFDFAGYSDMAIGLGRCMGFHFNENFDHPYISTSVSEFWRRWHISLGSFFRDYVYIPMGGNRRHQPINIIVVWFLTGLWHGAAWHFVLWGLYFAFFLVLEKYTIRRIKSGWAKPLLHLYTIFVILVSWGIFYDYDSLVHNGQFISRMLGLNGELTSFTNMSALYSHFWLWVAAIALCMPLRRWLALTTSRLLGGGSTARTLDLVARLAISLFVLLLSVSLLVGATNNTFLYYRF